MKKTKKKPRRHIGQAGKDKEEEKLPGYPLYPETEDIYNKSIKVIKIDPEGGASIIRAYEEKDLINDLLGNEIDVPNSVLEDKNEIAGTDDEEDPTENLFAT